MANVGIKVSRKGYDVTSCADREVAFSSLWKTLQIEHSASFDISAPDTMYTHNLNYYPFFMVFHDNDPVTGSADDYSRLATISASSMFPITDTTLEFEGGSQYQGRYYIFRLDLETDYTADSVQTTDTSAGTTEDRWGIAISKEGQDVHSTDFRNFVQHSNCRGAIVHMVEHWSIGSSGVHTHTVTHNLGYIPMFFVFVKLAGETGYRNAGNADDMLAVGTTTTVTVDDVYEGDYSVVILKDTFLVQ